MQYSKDKLTDCYDRASFLDILRRLVVEANEYKTNVALLLIDINRFYRVNKLYGYATGDLVLQQFAEMLNDVTRLEDYVGRLGDNLFGVVLTNIMNKGHTELAARKVMRLLQMPFTVNNSKITIECTIAISISPIHATEYSNLLKECEAVLYKAKKLRQPIMMSEKVDTGVQLSENWDVEYALETAIENGEFRVYYQPQASLDSGGVSGAEALIRWEHPTKGVIPPDVFVPIAERLDYIRPITNWLINTVLRQTEKWTDKWGPLSVSVNIPPEFVFRRDLKGFISGAMNLWQNHNVSLVLEIIERSIVEDPEETFLILQEVKDLGVRISIDDFGTGYSSLSYFENLPADELKIDQSFVKRMGEKSSIRNIVKVIIGLAHAFDMEVVAEGVEDKETLIDLKALGCDTVQGYFVAKPMTNEEMQAWLNTFTGIQFDK